METKWILKEFLRKLFALLRQYQISFPEKILFFSPTTSQQLETDIFLLIQETFHKLNNKLIKSRIGG
ncbi:MAG: hypothetical protein N2560_01625 [Ignavibacteria bacterium]|nr:hypothetical protein [Ignavibacteria bacterium]